MPTSGLAKEVEGGIHLTTSVPYWRPRQRSARRTPVARVDVGSGSLQLRMVSVRKEYRGVRLRSLPALVLVSWIVDARLLTQSD